MLKDLFDDIRPVDETDDGHLSLTLRAGQNSELLPIWITAVATAVTAFAVFIVERSRRTYERKEAHLGQIKEVVFEYLNSLLRDYYLPILGFRQGIHQIGQDPIYLNRSPSAESPVGWRPVLSIKAPGFSVPTTVGASKTFQEHEKIYPYLYTDVKSRHFPQLIDKWELFIKRFEELGQESLEAVTQLAKELEEKIKLPPFNGLPNQQGTWVNYLSLSVFLYERFWGVPSGTLNISEQSGKWVMRWLNGDCALGTKGDLEDCQAVVDNILNSQKGFIRGDIESLKRQALNLRSEAVCLKEELEELLLKSKLMGRCDYLKS